MDIVAADDSTLTAVKHTLAAVEAASHASPTASTTTSTSAASPAASSAVAPLTSKYSYTVCERCHKLGHTAQHCAPTHTAQQHKKRQPQQQPIAHKHSPTSPPVAPTELTTTQQQRDSVVDDEDAAAMIEQLSVTATPAPAASAAAVRASPYGEHMLPLCYMCEQRHDLGQCRKTKR